jgi:hypothetical protein
MAQGGSLKKKAVSLSAKRKKGPAANRHGKGVVTKRGEAICARTARPPLRATTPA